MKKTFNINIAGYPFVIDDDAYSMLNDYIETIEHAFERLEDYRELVMDIESRIAELLLEQTSSGSPIVTINDVEEVIRRVGKPEDMVEEDENITIVNDSGKETVIESETIREERTTPPPIPEMPKVNKKLYRDTQDSMLGGVCAGLGWYLNVDVTLIRLLTIVLVICSMSTCAVAYIVLWIIIPEARTPLQRMQMMGEAPTMENIGKTVTDNYKDDLGMYGQPVSRNNSFSNFVSTCLKIIVRILTVFGLIIGIPILLALGSALLACLFALVYVTTSLFAGVNGVVGEIPLEMVKYLTLLGVGAIIVIGIPLSLLVRKGIKPKGGFIGTSTKWTLLGVWIIGFILSAVSGVFFMRELDRYERNYSKNYKHYISTDGEDWDSAKNIIVNVKRKIDRSRMNSHRKNLNERNKRLEEKKKSLANKAEQIDKKSSGSNSEKVKTAKESNKISRKAAEKSGSVSVIKNDTTSNVATKATSKELNDSIHK